MATAGLPMTFNFHRHIGLGPGDISQETGLPEHTPVLRPKLKKKFRIVTNAIKAVRMLKRVKSSFDVKSDGSSGYGKSTGKAQVQRNKSLADLQEDARGKGKGKGKMKVVGNGSTIYLHDSNEENRLKKLNSQNMSTSSISLDFFAPRSQARGSTSTSTTSSTAAGAKQDDVKIRNPTLNRAPQKFWKTPHPSKARIMAATQSRLIDDVPPIPTVPSKHSLLERSTTEPDFSLHVKHPRKALTFPEKSSSLLVRENAERSGSDSSRGSSRLHIDTPMLTADPEHVSPKAAKVLGINGENKSKIKDKAKAKKEPTQAVPVSKWGADADLFDDDEDEGDEAHLGSMANYSAEPTSKISSSTAFVAPRSRLEPVWLPRRYTDDGIVVQPGVPRNDSSQSMSAVPSHLRHEAFASATATRSTPVGRSLVPRSEAMFWPNSRTRMNSRRSSENTASLTTTTESGLSTPTDGSSREPTPPLPERSAARNLRARRIGIVDGVPYCENDATVLLTPTFPPSNRSRDSGPPSVSAYSGSGVSRSSSILHNSAFHYDAAGGPISNPPLNSDLFRLSTAEYDAVRARAVQQAQEGRAGNAQAPHERANTSSDYDHSSDKRCASESDRHLDGEANFSGLQELALAHAQLLTRQRARPEGQDHHKEIIQQQDEMPLFHDKPKRASGSSSSSRPATSLGFASLRTFSPFECANGRSFTPSPEHSPKRESKRSSLRDRLSNIEIPLPNLRSVAPSAPFGGHGLAMSLKSKRQSAAVDTKGAGSSDCKHDTSLSIPAVLQQHIEHGISPAGDFSHIHPLLRPQSPESTPTTTSLRPSSRDGDSASENFHKELELAYAPSPYASNSKPNVPPSLFKTRPMGNSRWIPMLDPFDNHIHVVVGEETDIPPLSLRLPAKRLSQHSGSIRDQVEAVSHQQEQHIRFKLTDPRIFEIWLQWIYSRNLWMHIPWSGRREYITRLPDMDQAISAWELGRLLIDNDFQDACVDHIQVMCIGLPFLPWRWVRRVYRITEHDSGLRRLFLSTMAEQKLPRGWRKDEDLGREELGATAFAAYKNERKANGELWDKRREGTKNGSWREVGCQFHEHKGKECGSAIWKSGFDDD